MSSSKEKNHVVVPEAEDVASVGVEVFGENPEDAFRSVAPLETEEMDALNQWTTSSKEPEEDKVEEIRTFHSDENTEANSESQKIEKYEVEEFSIDVDTISTPIYQCAEEKAVVEGEITPGQVFIEEPSAGQSTKDSTKSHLMKQDHDSSTKIEKSGNDIIKEDKEDKEDKEAEELLAANTREYDSQAEFSSCLTKCEKSIETGNAIQGTKDWETEATRETTTEQSFVGSLELHTKKEPILEDKEKNREKQESNAKKKDITSTEQVPKGDETTASREDIKECMEEANMDMEDDIHMVEDIDVKPFRNSEATSHDQYTKIYVSEDLICEAETSQTLIPVGEKIERIEKLIDTPSFINEASQGKTKEENTEYKDVRRCDADATTAKTMKVETIFEEIQPEATQECESFITSDIKSQKSIESTCSDSQVKEVASIELEETSRTESQSEKVNTHHGKMVAKTIIETTQDEAEEEKSTEVETGSITIHQIFRGMDDGDITPLEVFQVGKAQATSVESTLEEHEHGNSTTTETNQDRCVEDAILKNEGLHRSTIEKEFIEIENPECKSKLDPHFNLAHNDCPVCIKGIPLQEISLVHSQEYGAGKEFAGSETRCENIADLREAIKCRPEEISENTNLVNLVKLKNEGNDQSISYLRVQGNSPNRNMAEVCFQEEITELKAEEIHCGKTNEVNETMNNISSTENLRQKIEVSKEPTKNYEPETIEEDTEINRNQEDEFNTKEYPTETTNICLKNEKAGQSEKEYEEADMKENIGKQTANNETAVEGPYQDLMGNITFEESLPEGREKVKTEDNFPEISDSNQHPKHETVIVSKVLASTMEENFNTGSSNKEDFTSHHLTRKGILPTGEYKDCNVLNSNLDYDSMSTIPNLEITDMKKENPETMTTDLRNDEIGNEKTHEANEAIKSAIPIEKTKEIKGVAKDPHFESKDENTDRKGNQEEELMAKEYQGVTNAPLKKENTDKREKDYEEAVTEKYTEKKITNKDTAAEGCHNTSVEDVEVGETTEEAGKEVNNVDNLPELSDSNARASEPERTYREHEPVTASEIVTPTEEDSWSVGSSNMKDFSSFHLTGREILPAVEAKEFDASNVDLDKMKNILDTEYQISIFEEPIRLEETYTKEKLTGTTFTHLEKDEVKNEKTYEAHEAVRGEIADAQEEVAKDFRLEYNEEDTPRNGNQKDKIKSKEYPGVTTSAFFEKGKAGKSEEKNEESNSGKQTTEEGKAAESAYHDLVGYVTEGETHPREKGKLKDVDNVPERSDSNDQDSEPKKRHTKHPTVPVFEVIAPTKEEILSTKSSDKEDFGTIHLTAAEIFPAREGEECETSYAKVSKNECLEVTAAGIGSSEELQDMKVDLPPDLDAVTEEKTHANMRKQENKAYNENSTEPGHEAVAEYAENEEIPEAETKKSESTQLNVSTTNICFPLEEQDSVVIISTAETKGLEPTKASELERSLERIDETRSDDEHKELTELRKENSQIEDPKEMKIEGLLAGKETVVENEKSRTDEGGDGEEKSLKQKVEDSSTSHPMIEEVSRDVDLKVAHKKSHNILSGVGSKVKHSISKVKKAITGRSSHSKSHSPKSGKN